MELNVLLFASYAEAFGGPSIRVSVADDAVVSDLLAAVRQLVPGKPLPPAAVAVNHEYAALTHRLSREDEVAIIPPVAGG